MQLSWKNSLEKYYTFYSWTSIASFQSKKKSKTNIKKQILAAGLIVKDKGKTNNLKRNWKSKLDIYLDTEKIEGPLNYFLFPIMVS